MRIRVIGSVDAESQVCDSDVELLLKEPVQTMGYGRALTGKPSTRIHMNDQWLAKMDMRRRFDTLAVAIRWCELQREREADYAIYHPLRTWFVVKEDGSWLAGNVTPVMQPLSSVDFSTISSGERLSLLAGLLEIYCRFTSLTEKRLDEGLSNFGLYEQQVWYLDDDIYAWDGFASFSAMLANWLRRSSYLELDEEQWKELGECLKPLLRSCSSTAVDMVCEAIQDQLVGGFEQHKLALISGMRERVIELPELISEEEQADEDMAIGLIADVHANLPAFRAVLGAFQSRGIRRIMHLGDIVGYGPHPAECIALAREFEIFCLRGNHDHYVAHDGDVKVAASTSAKWTLDWTLGQLGDDDKQWLGELPVRHRMPGWMAVHGSPIDKSFFNGYVYNMTAEKNLEYLIARKIPLCLHGHSHIQGMYAMRGRVVQPFSAPGMVDLRAYMAALVCPGSVGQPRDGQIDAEAAIYYPSSNRVEFFSIAYDVGAVASAMESAGFPEQIVARQGSGR